jgi:hypothetical protein
VSPVVEPNQTAPPAAVPPARAGLVLLGLAVLLLSGPPPFVDPDVYHGLSLVREALSLGEIPRDDRFAYTPTVSPVVHHEWAEAGVLYFIVTYTGGTGLVVLKHSLSLGIAAGVFLLARRRGASLGVACSLAPVAIFLGWMGLTTVRAQVFTLFFLVVLLWFLEEDRRGKRWWIGPWLALHVVWLNVHGGFVVGCVLFAAHALEQALRRRPTMHLVLAGLAMAALVPLNPWGTAYYGYIWKAVLLDRSVIEEWRPVWRAWAPITLVYGISLLVAIYGIAKVGLRRAEGWPLVALAAYAALRHQRHLSIHALVWFAHVPAIVQCTELGRALQTSFASPRRWVTPIAGVVAILVIARLIRVKPWELQVPANPGDNRITSDSARIEELIYPVGAVAYLREAAFHGNLMVPFLHGAYITWHLYPRVRVSLDGRFEVAYPPGALQESRIFYFASPGWQEVLARHPTDAVLVPVSLPASKAMREAATWTLVYQDDAYELYARPGLDLPRRDSRGKRFVGSFP